MQGMTVLAFDYGLKNIGLAIGQSVSQSVSELSALKARDGIPNWKDIEALLNEWQPDIVLVGLPLNMDGSESEMALRARKFSQRLHGRFGCKVELIDERLSSAEAKDIARERGHKGNYGENPIDSLAACVLLEAWWRVDQSG